MNFAERLGKSQADVLSMWVYTVGLTPLISSSAWHHWQVNVAWHWPVKPVQSIGTWVGLSFLTCETCVHKMQTGLPRALWFLVLGFANIPGQKPSNPCMEYLPTFTINIRQMWVNIPYMDAMGNDTAGVRLVVTSSSFITPKLDVDSVWGDVSAIIHLGESLHMVWAQFCSFAMIIGQERLSKQSAKFLQSP